ncbi:hypothetical protein [Paenibacillus sp. Lou8.1]|uniref:hypothetical protein n=1 Tax=Paenibacillus sp. Lou8.1 TaxID=2962041 RepID=UPI0020B66967|nr:hypothetical protein [Paenibacillus sp. Lou8.1]
MAGAGGAISTAAPITFTTRLLTGVAAMIVATSEYSEGTSDIAKVRQGDLSQSRSGLWQAE